MGSRRRKGLPLNYGDYNAGYVENITKMMFQVRIRIMLRTKQ